MKIVASQVANYVREPAIKFMEDTLQRFKDGEIQLVYAHNDDMALGAVTALEAANRQKGVMVVGIDGENAAYDAIKAGKMVATFTYHFVAPEGVQYGYKIAKGEKARQGDRAPHPSGRQQQCRSVPRQGILIAVGQPPVLPSGAVP